MSKCEYPIEITCNNLEEFSKEIYKAAKSGLFLVDFVESTRSEYCMFENDDGDYAINIHTTVNK